MRAMQKYAHLAALLILFILSLTAPGPIVLMVLQLVLMIGSVLVAHAYFGDQLIAFYAQLRGDDDGDDKGTDEAPQSRGAKRNQEPTVAAGSGTATEGERNPS